MQGTRLIYSSLDNERAPILEHHPKRQKTKKKKSNKNNSSGHSQLNTAAKIYLNQLKLVPKHQIHSLLKSANIAARECQFLTQKLTYEIERRKEEENVKKQIRMAQEQQLNNNNDKKKSNKKLADSFKVRYGIKNKTTKYFHLSSIEKPEEQKSERPIRSQRHIIDFDQTLRFRQKMSRQKQEKHPRPPQRQSFKQIQKLYLKSRIYQKPRYNFEIQDQIVINQEETERNSISKSKSKSKDITHNNDSVNSLINYTNKLKRSTIKCVKGFVVNQRNQLVTKLLIQQGWKQFSETSQRFTLKWTFNDSFKDYQLIRASNKTNQVMYFNHMNNNKLVNKDDFLKLARQISKKGVDISSFIPQTYLLHSQKINFMSSYQNRIMINCLEKHYRYFQIKFPLPLENSIEEEFKNFESGIEYLVNISDENCDQLINADRSEDFVVNFPLLYNILVIAAKIITQKQNFLSNQFQLKFKQLLNDKAVYFSLNMLSKADLLFQQYFKNRSSGAKKAPDCKSQKQISIVNGYLKAVKTFMTPSRKFISLVSLFFHYFNHNIKNHILGGSKNLWILKPCNGSKGIGIQIVDRIDRINQISESSANRIIQKYIENVWTLKKGDLQKLQSWGQKYMSLVNKKFDIRQWVLLTPHQTYIFSSFYIRVCSKQYDINLLQDQCSHLSNFSINKEYFHKIEESVLSEQQFQKLLVHMNTNRKFSEIKGLLKQRVSLLTSEAMNYCQQLPGTFQLIGFDILLDQYFNPWIIECNMSPACNTRTDWLRQMKKEMTEGVLQLVIDKSLYAAKASQRKYRWQKLSKVENKREKLSLQFLCRESRHGKNTRRSLLNQTNGHGAQLPIQQYI